MAIIDLGKSATVDTSKDCVVIQKFFEDVPGGRSLDTAALPAADTVVLAGHVIIQETATKEFKALGTSAGSYVSLPASHTYAGILRATVKKSEPLASIMVRGTVNVTAAVSAQGLPSYPAGAITALTLIRFI